MNNMRLASRNKPIAPPEISYSHINNPRIMKIVNDSYGNLNKKFNPGQVQTSSNFPPPVENSHFMLSGNTFVPVQMDTWIAEPQVQEKVHKPSRYTSQGTVLRAKNIKSQASLMPLPVPGQNGNKNYTNSVQSTNLQTCTSTNNELNKSVKENEQLKDNKGKTKTIFCTGTIERLLRWNRDLEDVFCMYEIIAPIVSLQEGRIKNQKIMLLRDKKGPILQVQYYTSTHIDIDDFYIGQYLRCVGRMIGFNILSADSIREAKEIEISTLARLSYVCDYSVTHNLNTT